MYSKRDLIYRGFEKKSKGWRFDFRGPNLFWQRDGDCIMSYPNAELIAVSFACSNDPKSPYSVYSVWGPLS